MTEEQEEAVREVVAALRYIVEWHQGEWQERLDHARIRRAFARATKAGLPGTESQ